MNYYSNQLERLNLNSEFEPTVIISDSEGNKTNAMNINEESAKVLINFFSQFLPQAKPLNEVRKIEFTRINNDVNGNPRYVCHFLEFITDNDNGTINEKYNLALTRAKSLGGRKYNNKSFGGGIVFQSYNSQGLEKEIINLSK